MIENLKVEDNLSGSGCNMMKFTGLRKGKTKSNRIKTMNFNKDENKC